jgi:hypothetical protein
MKIKKKKKKLKIKQKQVKKILRVEISRKLIKKQKIHKNERMNYGMIECKYRIG